MKAWLLSISLLMMALAATAAQTAVEKGRAIAVEADRLDAGWGDARAEMEMVLRNRQGQESRRRIHTRLLEVKNDGDKSLLVFEFPRDVKGTALLSYSHAVKADDQWLFLPAIKRVKRIASANKSGPFMGSEFAYEDLTSQEVAKYHYRWLRDETLDGHPTFVIERRPAYEHSGYTRQVAWLDQSNYRPLKVDYYDRKNALLKTLTVHGYRRYLDRYWRPDRMEMVNHQTGKSTTLRWSGYHFKSGLSDRDFDRNALKRVR